MSEQAPIVYVVHCVDTEGPLDESLDATFQRIKDIFDIDLDPSRETLLDLQAGKIALGDKTESIRKMLDPSLLRLNRNWQDIDRMLEHIAAPTFRNRVTDSVGGGWVYNWFCVDHVGYEFNPRNRDLGHHRVFDRYRQRCGSDECSADRVFFHYHPLPHNRFAHSCATCYVNSNHLWEILGRKIIERHWFPSVFRPGFHATRPDSNWFLEQWIPFDYANQATDADVNQPDLAGGRFGDWRHAPRIWGAYHPSHDDYQSPGGCRRWIFRCLNMNARLRELTQKDVHLAFSQAEQKGAAILAFTNHDFRDMAAEVDKIRRYILEAARQRPGVEFRFVDAITAARRYLGMDRIQSLGLRASLSASTEQSLILRVSVAAPLFGPQPFLAIQNMDGDIFYDNFDRSDDPYGWSYTFDSQTVMPDALAAVGIAATGAEGQVELANIRPHEGRWSYEVLNG